MKVLHICLSCFYIDNFNYQENLLVQQHVADGHDVLVLASTEIYGEDGQLTYCEPGHYMGTDGARVIRIPYRRWLPGKVMQKLRAHPNVYEHLEEFAPDTILFHGACGFELTTVARYCRNHPKVPFYVDSHEDWGNSARGFVSREILHKIYYRTCLQAALPQIEKVLGVTPERCDFVREVYKVPPEQVELYPLGGFPVHDPEYSDRRARTRAALSISDSQVAFAMTGKMKARRGLVETLREYTKHGPENSVFLIAGVLTEESKDAAYRLIKADERIRFLGWQAPEQLTDLLCATDIYLNPGSHTATTEHSLCCHCAVGLSDVAAHRFLVRSNGWLVDGETTLAALFRNAGSCSLRTQQDNSYALACDTLDYAVLAKRVLYRTHANNRLQA